MFAFLFRTMSLCSSAYLQPRDLGKKTQELGYFKQCIVDIVVRSSSFKSDLFACTALMYQKFHSQFRYQFATPKRHHGSASLREERGGVADRLKKVCTDRKKMPQLSKTFRVSPIENY